MRSNGKQSQSSQTSHVLLLLYTFDLRFTFTRNLLRLRLFCCGTDNDTRFHAKQQREKRKKNQRSKTRNTIRVWRESKIEKFHLSFPSYLNKHTPVPLLYLYLVGDSVADCATQLTRFESGCMAQEKPQIKRKMFSLKRCIHIIPENHIQKSYVITTNRHFEMLTVCTSMCVHTVDSARGFGGNAHGECYHHRHWISVFLFWFLIVDRTTTITTHEQWVSEGEDFDVCVCVCAHVEATAWGEYE